MIEHLWFQNSIEGLFVRNLRGYLTDEIRADLRSIGLNVDRLEPAYPVGTLRRAIERLGPVVLPGASSDAQQWELGRRLTRGYFDTMMGRALTSVLRLVGPQRGITRIHRSFRGITNYINAYGEVIRPGEGRVVFDPVDGLAPFLTGIMAESGGLLLQGGETRVTLVADMGDRCEVRLEWNARLN